MHSENKIITYLINNKVIKSSKMNTLHNHSNKNNWQGAISTPMATICLPVADSRSFDFAYNTQGEKPSGFRGPNNFQDKAM